MRDANVRMLLFLSILVTATLPFLVSLYLLQHTLQTSLNIAFNAHVTRVLDNASENLRRLGRLDAANREGYRTQFEDVANLKYVYSNPVLIRNGIESSLQTYFAVGLIVSVLLSVLIAAMLGRRIARSYQLAFDELTRQREKVRYLQEMSSWQELAKMLAHEIKNPLTPIEVLVSSLSRSFLQKSRKEFQEQLAETATVIHEEIGQLKATVNRFGEFARLPQVQLSEQHVAELIRQHVKAIAVMFERAQLRILEPLADARADVDSVLFRQVLVNIIRNGIEANPDRSVTVEISMIVVANSLQIAISNDGVPVPTEIAARIFDPYVSSRSSKDNMGLGLAIVKKIIIEHGGEVSYAEEHGRPRFLMTLPRSA